jgi:hypothetical protein
VVNPIETPKFGWLGIEAEHRDLQRYIDSMEVCGKQCYVPFDDVKYKIYSEADLYEKWIPDWFKDYNYKQDSSNGCAAINGAARTIWYALQLMKRKWKEVIPFRVLEAWVYMLYHAYIEKDYKYGGCTMIGVMEGINKYGVLPYDVFGNVITDKDMVNLGWNRKQKSAEIMEKYGKQAEQFQIKTTIPKTFEDVKACLRAGYAVGYGTDIGLRKNSNGIYQITGRIQGHSMTYAFYKDGYFGNSNSYGDNFGWLAESDARRQIERPHFVGICVIDIERSRRSEANW